MSIVSYRLPGSRQALTGKQEAVSEPAGGSQVAMKRIFIISSYAMFGRGLNNLLNQESNIEIVGQETGIEQASDQITTLQPDVVIFDSDDPARASTPVLLYRILKEHGGIQVIGLSLQNNKFRVYGVREGIVHEVADLLKAIFHEPSSPI